jgi:hypothetical protein
LIVEVAGLLNIWRKVWGEFCIYRRDLNERGVVAQTKWYSEKLKRPAAKLWKNRYIFFKSDENLTTKERRQRRRFSGHNHKCHSFVLSWTEYGPSLKA